MSIYGEHLGPEAACNGSADAHAREQPNPQRRNQTLIEIQVFPKKLCETEVRVGGVAAGLLYVQAAQINFKVPQEIGVQGTARVQVFHKGQSGPLVTETLAAGQNEESADRLAQRIWESLKQVPWQAAYRPGAGCTVVRIHPALRFGLYGYAFSCGRLKSGLIAESFYYPTGVIEPRVVLRRADFRLANPYAALSDEVEQSLRIRLTRAYGPGTVPDRVYEIGANLPQPGLSWRAGDVTIFLHKNRNFAAPAGVREGVLLVAVRREVLEERELKRELDKAFESSTAIAERVVVADLAKDLSIPELTSRKRTEAETAATLFSILREIDKGERATRAARLVAADHLTVSLGSLLVVRTITKGSEAITEAPDGARVRNRLAAFGVHYTGPGHYSGNMEYDRIFLRRAWNEFPETSWGQRAFLLLQRLSCSFSIGTQGFEAFHSVIQQGQEFLKAYPRTPFRKEQIYNLALANETWWSLSQPEAGDPTVEGAHIDRAAAGRARKNAIDLYEELFRIAPESPEARAGQLVLPRLKLKLGTGERAFFCYSD